NRIVALLFAPSLDHILIDDRVLHIGPGRKAQRGARRGGLRRAALRLTTRRGRHTSRQQRATGQQRTRLQKRPAAYLQFRLLHTTVFHCFLLVSSFTWIADIGDWLPPRPTHHLLRTTLFTHHPQTASGSLPRGLAECAGT